MKKQLFTLCLITCLILSGCSTKEKSNSEKATTEITTEVTTETTTPPAETTKKYIVNKLAFELNPGESEKIEFTAVIPKQVTFESSNPDIASVTDDGTINALSSGEAKIKCVTNENTIVCCVTVKNKTTEKITKKPKDKDSTTEKSTEKTAKKQKEEKPDICLYDDEHLKLINIDNGFGFSGTSSVSFAKSSEVTKKVLTDWYFNHVEKTEYNSYFVVYTDKENQGVYAISGFIQKNVEISYDEITNQYWLEYAPDSCIIYAPEGNKLVKIP